MKIRLHFFREISPVFLSWIYNFFREITIAFHGPAFSFFISRTCMLHFKFTDLQIHFTVGGCAMCIQIFAKIRVRFKFNLLSYSIIFWISAGYFANPRSLKNFKIDFFSTLSLFVLFFSSFFNYYFHWRTRVDLVNARAWRIQAKQKQSSKNRWTRTTKTRSNNQSAKHTSTNSFHIVVDRRPCFAACCSNCPNFEPLLLLLPLISSSFTSPWNNFGGICAACCAAHIIQAPKLSVDGRRTSSSNKRLVQ